MLFCLFNWNGIEGIEIVLTGCVLCMGAFSILSTSLRRNRTHKGPKRIGIAMLSCELLCSLLWLLIFYSHGTYHNYGLQGMLFGLIYPALLAAAWVIIALYPKIKAKKMNKERI